MLALTLRPVLALAPTLLGVPFGLPQDKAPETETIPLYLSDRRVLAMLRVGDHAPAPVVFDTGTNGNLLDLAYAKSLGLPENGPSPSIDGSTGKPVPGFDTFIKDARLGGVRIADARATAFAYPVTDEVGIFGPNSFPDRLVTLDLAKGRLIVQPKSPATLPAGPSFPYNARRLPSIPIDLGGVRVDALLDTGNDAPMLLPLSLASKLRLAKPLTEVGTATSAAGTQPVYGGRLKGKVRVASVVLESPRLLFIEGGGTNVGLALIRQFRIVLDPTEGRTWVLPPAPKAKP